MSNWETILKNTLEEIQMEEEEQYWDGWLKENDRSAFDEYVSEINEACMAIEAEWQSRVRLMREATNTEEYVQALES